MVLETIFGFILVVFETIFGFILVVLGTNFGFRLLGFLKKKLLTHIDYC